MQRVRLSKQEVRQLKKGQVIAGWRLIEDPTRSPQGKVTGRCTVLCECLSCGVIENRDISQWASGRAGIGCRSCSWHVRNPSGKRPVKVVS